MNNDYSNKYLNVCEKLYMRDRPIDVTTIAFWIFPKFLEMSPESNEVIYVTREELLSLYKILELVFESNYRFRNYFRFLANKTSEEIVDIQNFKYETDLAIKKLKDLNEINFGDEEF